jgi:hypothetical protein
MSTYWLRNKLASSSNAVTDGGDPVLTIKHNEGTIAVYCPNPDEYAVSADLIDKAKSLGANMVAYATTWCTVTYEGRAYGRSKGVDVVPFAGLFAVLRKKGVVFKD